MSENKLYQLCREEAERIIIEKYPCPSEITILMIYQNELSQLTAEIYGMKLLEWSSKSNLTIIHGAWCLNNKEIFSLTQDLHDHFVEQYNKEGK